MNLRRTRIPFVMLGVAVLSATVLPPASATTVKVVEFTGTAWTSHGLGYPGAPPDMKIPCTTGGIPDPGCVTVKPGPKGEPVVNFAPEGNHASFAIGSIACVKVSASTDLAKKTPGPALCAIGVGGSVWGYCGLSTGVGVMWITNFGPPPFTKDPHTISIEVKFTTVAGYLYLTGGTLTTHVHSLMSLQPAPETPGGPSCWTKTANAWTLHGRAVFKDIT